MTRIERSVREWLGDWQVWVGIAYFGLAAVVVALFVLFNRTAHEEAVRAATARSAAAAQVGQCFSSSKNGPVARGFFDAHKALIDNSIATTEAALRVAKPNDPLRQVRVQSLRRLFAAERNADQLEALIDRTTPTRQACMRLAARLNVNPAQYEHTSH